MCRRKFFLYVSLRFVKFLATALIPNIINFFNFWYSRDIFSADWKVFSKIIQLPRISNLSNCNLPLVSKAFQVCMPGQTDVEYLMLNKFLDPLQSGFKANLCKTTTLRSVLTLLDFFKAFSSINHEFLLMKL
jgi:hypothetical protein